jgi:hypothetical protein
MRKNTNKTVPSCGHTNRKGFVKSDFHNLHTTASFQVKDVGLETQGLQLKDQGLGLMTHGVAWKGSKRHAPMV